MRLILAALLFLPLPAMAQLATSSSNDAPLEITGQQALEWDQTAKLYKAVGGAKATQGNFSVSADEMQAHYETDQSELTTIDALGNVVIESEGRIAKGEKAVYDMRTSDAVLTGGNLSFTAPDTSVTARDKFTVNTKTNVFNAYGNAVATQTQDGQTRKISGDHLSATFAKDAAGKTALSSMTATGNVAIKAGEDNVKGDKAVYNAVTQQAEVTGANVVLTRGPNILTGEKATVDMNTNVSKLYGGTAAPAKAVFYPNSNKKTGAP